VPVGFATNAVTAAVIACALVMAPLNMVAASYPVTPTVSHPRRLIVLFDGTLNSPEEGRQRADSTHPYPHYLPTNILKLYRAILPVASDRVSQISFYSDGVGSFAGNPAAPGRLLKALDQFYGGLAGVGYEDRVKSAYRFLVGNYHPGDQIYIFGFSRGAAEARTLTVFMDWVGGLLHKDDEYYVPELFLAWQAARGHCTAHPWFTKMAAWVQPPQPATVAFLGVFDTVISLGFRLSADFRERDTPTVGPQYDYYIDKAPPPCVRAARQALAADERRWDFRPQIWESARSSVVQEWFPGAHSNIGGGYPDDALSHATLLWMANGAHDAGLDLDYSYLNSRPGTQTRVYQTDSGLYRAWEWLRGKAGKGARHPPPSAIHREP
jgi:uncharacterized protein (DUF2235 family)